ncbi:MAG: B12-binding domain-containing protein [Anaerolineales bacterium]|nr:B12-binding domain-containing protein [Anaerolineales bacterium]MDW8162235.1 B12-binding domain-containing protein [Anaerolineales bacterium]
MDRVSLASKLENQKSYFAKLITHEWWREKPSGRLAHQYFDALLRNDRINGSETYSRGCGSRNFYSRYLRVFEPCLHEVGRLWQTQQISIAQEHYFTASTQFIMAQLYPLIFQSLRNGRRMVAACVANELHEIGLRMVVDF